MVRTECPVCQAEEEPDRGFMPEDEFLAALVTMSQEAILDGYRPIAVEARRCTREHGWMVVVDDGRPVRTVEGRALSPSEYHEATGYLLERVRLAAAVCDELLARPGEYDGVGIRDTHHRLIRWIHETHGSESTVRFPLSGSPRSLATVVVPDNQIVLIDLLRAATHVCESLEFLWTASISEYPQDRAEVDAGLVVYQDRVAALAGESGANDGPNDDDDDEDDDWDLRFDYDGGAYLRRLIARSGEAPEPPVHTLVWGELQDLAESVFGVDTSEMVWARYLWVALDRAGLATFQTDVERARVICRLQALEVLRTEFRVRAFDDGESGRWSVDESALTGDYPLISVFTLGVLGEREGVVVDEEVDLDWVSDGPTPEADVLRELVRSACDEVARTLRRELSAARVFASMWTAGYDGMRYPLPDTVLDELLNSGLSGEKMYAYDWVEAGMPVS